MAQSADKIKSGKDAKSTSGGGATPLEFTCFCA
jgi:hypothetical protein